MDFDEYKIENGGIWLPKEELEKKFHDLRQRGYNAHKLYMEEGWEHGQYVSTACQSKADLLWDLISLIEEQNSNCAVSC